MKKLLVILVLLVSIFGCNASINEQTINNQINKVLGEKNPLPNNAKNYFNYYLPHHITKVTSDELNSVLKSNGVEIILSVNPAEIVKDYNVVRTRDAGESSFQRELTLFENLVVSTEGEFFDDSGKTIKYSVHINQYNEYKYLITMKVGYSKLTSVVFKANTLNILKDMFLIGRSVKTNNQLILNNYRYQEQEVEANVGFNSSYYPNEGYLTDDYSQPEVNFEEPENQEEIYNE